MYLSTRTQFLHRAVKTSLRATGLEIMEQPFQPFSNMRVPLYDLCMWSSSTTWAWLKRNGSSTFFIVVSTRKKVFLTYRIDILILFIQILLLGGLREEILHRDISVTEQCLSKLGLQCSAPLPASWPCGMEQEGSPKAVCLVCTEVSRFVFMFAVAMLLGPWNPVSFLPW